MEVSKEDVVSIVEDAVVSVDVDKLNRGLNFKECGVDSLEVMNVFLGIEEKYGIKIEDEEVDKLNTVDDVVAFLSNQ